MASPAPDAGAPDVAAVPDPGPGTEPPLLDVAATPPESVDAGVLPDIVAAIDIPRVGFPPDVPDTLALADILDAGVQPDVPPEACPEVGATQCLTAGNQKEATPYYRECVEGPTGPT